MRCQDLMSTEVQACRETDSALDCAVVMRKFNIGFCPVLDSKGHVVGVVTDRDLALRVLAASRPPGVQLQDVMTRHVITCAPDEDLRSAERRMADERISRVVVMTEVGHCVGVLSLSDIVRVEESGRVSGVLRSVASREGHLPPAENA